MLTDARTPFLGTPLVSPRSKTRHVVGSEDRSVGERAGAALLDEPARNLSLGTSLLPHLFLTLCFPGRMDTCGTAFSCFKGCLYVLASRFFLRPSPLTRLPLPLRASSAAETISGRRASPVSPRDTSAEVRLNRRVCLMVLCYSCFVVMCAYVCYACYYLFVISF